MCHHLNISEDVSSHEVMRYYAVIAEDDQGNQGQVSNIVRVTVTWDTVDTDLTLVSSVDSDQGTESHDSLMVSIMSACLGALFIICITIISCLYITSRTKRPSSPTPSSSTNTKVRSVKISYCRI